MSILTEKMGYPLAFTEYSTIRLLRVDEVYMQCSRSGFLTRALHYIFLLGLCNNSNNVIILTTI